MLKENIKLELKKMYCEMKEKQRSQSPHQMINGKESQTEKINFARTNNPRRGFLKLGDDPIILDYLAHNTEQENFPYYSTGLNDNVLRHCFINYFFEIIVCITNITGIKQF